MTSLLLLLVQVSLAANPPAPTADRCRGVVDRADGCAAPKDAPADVREDPKGKPPALRAADPAVLPGEMGFFGLGLGLLGGAALVSTVAFTPPRETEEQRALRDATRAGGYVLLGGAGLALSASLAFLAFDPSTGAFSWTSLQGDG
jgi:hypothetical protein